MTDQDLVNEKIGNIGSVDVAFKGGALVLSAVIQAANPAYGLKFSNTTELSVGPKEILDALSAKIGGPVPAAVAKFLEDALALT